MIYALHMWKRLSLPILTGILIGTSYIPFPPWAIFFCYVPLWWHWLQTKSTREIFVSGWIAQFILTAIGFNWVAHTVHEFGNLPWPAAILTLFLFCSIANLQIPAAGLVWHWLFRQRGLSPNLQILSLPFLLAAGERLYPMIFDWHFGYTWLWAKFPAFHLADIFGFLGLSTITFFMNYLGLRAFILWKTSQAFIKPLGTMLLLFGALNIWGYWHMRQLPAPDAMAKVLIAQSNISNEEKVSARHGGDVQQYILDRFKSVTLKGLTEPVDFAIWPETAFPDMVTQPEMQYGLAASLRDFLAENKLPLVTGTYSRHTETRQITNSIVALNEQGTWASPPYHKTNLLAFGEYFPGAQWFPIVKKWFPEVADFARGNGPQILFLNNLRLGGQICYEGLFDSFTRSLANQGAQLITNVTNDSWYDRWMEPLQHGYMTLARAIEVRRPLIRSTNTGISMVILADGTILEKSPIYQEWSHLYKIPYLMNPPATRFMTWGYWIFPVFLLFGILGILAKGLFCERNDSSRLD